MDNIRIVEENCRMVINIIVSRLIRIIFILFQANGFAVTYFCEQTSNEIHVHHTTRQFFAVMHIRGDISAKNLLHELILYLQ